MKTYDEKHVKNIALVGASKCGMTTLAEAMHYEAGRINRLGTIEAGSTVSDYTEVEKEKGISVTTTPMLVEWKHYKINMLDAPGYDDFIGEALNSIRIAETTVLMINAVKGVEPTTEVLWNEIDRMKKPVILAVNQVDHPQANWQDTFQSMQILFGNRMLPMQFPAQTGESFHEIVDALTMVMYRFKPEGGKPDKVPIPEEFQEQANEMHQQIVEAAASNDEELLDHFLERGTLTEEELQEGLKIGMKNHEIFPVFCMSAKLDMGSGRLMGFVDQVSPSAVEMDEEIQTSGTPTLFVYKTAYEPNLGKVSYFKVVNGKVKSGDRLTNHNDSGSEESLGQLYLMDGRERENIDELMTGDLGAAVKLKEVITGDTLSKGGKGVTFPRTQFPEDRIIKAVNAKSQADQEKVAAALRRLAEQDDTLNFSVDPEQHQMLVGCQGDVQLDVARWILENDFNLEVEWSDPKIAYRETIGRGTIASYRHKKQSGGAGQFAEVKMRVEPWHEGKELPEGYPIRGQELVDLPWGGKLEVINSIVGGVIDTRFIPSIQKGVIEAMEEGPIRQSPMQDIRIVIFDGKMHPVDSNDMAFKSAASHAFKLALDDARPILLEPVLEVTLTVPEFALGDTITEVQTRRGLILGMEAIGKNHRLTGHIPKAETTGLPTALRSIAHGQAGYQTKFLALKPAPLESVR